MQIQGTTDGKQALASLNEISAKKIGRAAESAMREKTPEAAQETAAQFETYFATMLVRELKKALPEGFFSGAGADVYGAWFDEFVGESLADSESLGVAGMIKTELARTAAAQAHAVNQDTTEERAK